MHDYLVKIHLSERAIIADLLVLVNAHDVEPVRFLGSRLEELHLAITESSEQPLVSNIAHSIERELGLSLL